MSAFPFFKTRQRGFLVGRVRDYHEWHLRTRRARLLRGGLSARWGHPRRFALHLTKVWRPRRVAQTRGFVLCRELEQFFEGTRHGVDACVRIAEFRETPRNREYGEIGRLAVRDLMPVQRRGDSRIGQRTHGIRRAGGPILGVLILVEEHPVPLLFPPFRTGQGGRTPLDCAGQSDRRAAYFAEGPTRLNPHVHVHPAGAAGLGPATKAHFLEERFHLKRDVAHVRPTDARAGIEIDAQLVRVIEIPGAYGVRVQLDATQVDDPGQPRRIVDDDLLRGAA